MKEKILSIIMPVYNVEKYISNSLDSIVLNENGTDDWLEIILVDDGSTDNSGKICDQYALKYSFIKVIHQKNQGQAAARNAALDIARGEWIAFVDSDDIVRANYLSVLLSNIQNNTEADIIIFKFKSFNDGDHIQNESAKFYIKNISILSKSTSMYYLTTDEIGNYMWNKIFRKQIFDSIRFPVGRQYEDISILYKCFQLADKLYLYNDYLYFYRQRSNSTVNTRGTGKALKFLKDSIQARNEQLNFFKKYKYYHALENASHYFMIDSVHYILLINKLKLPKDEEYLNIQKFIHSYKPRVNEGKFYLFIKLYNLFPRLVEKCLGIINF